MEPRSPALQADSLPADWDRKLYQLSHKGSPRILEWVAYPDPGIKPRSPTLQVVSLPTEPQGKPYHFYRVKKLSGTVSLEKAERRISHVNKSMQMKFKFASALSVVSQRVDNTYRGHWGSLFRQVSWNSYCMKQPYDTLLGSKYHVVFLDVKTSRKVKILEQ